MRPEKNFRICLIAFSLLTGCEKGPKITICIQDPPNNVLQCVRPDKTTFELPYPQSENYVCTSPSDTEQLYNYCFKNRKP